MKSKIIFIITILVVILCTTTIYQLLFEAQSKLFYINVLVACLAEVILLANVSVLSHSSLLTIKRTSLAISLNIFAITLFLWTTGYSLFMNGDGNLKSLYIGLLIIIVAFIASGATIIMGGKVTEKQAEEIQDTIKNKKDFSRAINRYWVEIKNELENINSDWKDKTLYSLEVIFDKIHMIPSRKFTKHPDLADELATKIEEIHSLCKEVNSVPKSDKLYISINLKINRLQTYLQTIKSSL